MFRRVRGEMKPLWPARAALLPRRLNSVLSASDVNLSPNDTWECGAHRIHTRTIHSIRKNNTRVWLAGRHLSVCVNASGACFPQHRELIWVCSALGQIYGPYTQRSTVLLVTACADLYTSQCKCVIQRLPPPWLMKLAVDPTEVFGELG